jgi:metallophosphoesterase superfamily enzyme
MEQWHDSKEKILVIGDTQAPFQHKDCLAFLKAMKKKYRPTKIVHIGDLTDSYHLGAWAKDPDALSQSDEIAQMLTFNKEIAKIFPKVSILISNHDLRLKRSAQRAMIHSHFLKEYNEWMGLPKGWVFHEELDIDGIYFHHGDVTGAGAGGANAGISRALNMGGPCVFGHHHTFSEVRYVATPKQLMWSMFVGSLVDHKKVGFAYAKRHLRKSIMSSGIILNGKPTIEPMVLDENGDWIGRLL